MKIRNVRKKHTALLIPVFICILLLQSGCQEQIKLDKASPKITFEKLNHDFGQIGTMSQKKIAKFKFTNTGEGLLIIAEVERCCNVTTKLDRTEYAPGESGLLKIEYQSIQKPGPDSKIVYVRSNDKTNPRLALTIKAMVVSKISYSPKSIRLFLEEKNAGCPKIVLSSLDNQPFSITRFTSTGESITADIDSSVEATKFVLSPSIDMEKLKVNPKGRIGISLTHPEERTAQIPFDMLPKYSISPSLMILTNIIPKKPIVRKVSVLNNYGGAFEIESFLSKNNTVKILRQETISSGYQFDVEITPPPAGGKYVFTEELTIKIKGSNELVVTCQGFYKERS